MAPIAAHFLNISGEGRSDVYSTKESIQFGSRRSPLAPAIVSAGLVLLEAVDILLAPRSPVPPYFGFRRDDELPAVAKLDGDLDCLEDLREYIVLAVLGVLDEEGVVDLKEYLNDIELPNAEHPGIKYIPD
jgi:hypothetical protein